MSVRNHCVDTRRPTTAGVGGGGRQAARQGRLAQGWDPRGVLVTGTQPPPAGGALSLESDLHLHAGLRLQVSSCLPRAFNLLVAGATTFPTALPTTKMVSEPHHLAAVVTLTLGLRRHPSKPQFPHLYIGHIMALAPPHRTPAPPFTGSLGLWCVCVCLRVYMCVCVCVCVYLSGCARSRLWHIGSSFPTRDQTHAPCIGNMES